MAPQTALPTSTPAAQGVDARGLHAFLDAVEAAPAIEPHSLMVLRHRQLVASGWWSPYRADRPHLLYSLSKSFTSTALGLAVAEGRLGLDDRVVDFFPEYRELADGRAAGLRVRHIAAMSSGHTRDTLNEVAAADRAELVRGFLRLPPDEAPGSVFAYNQPATYTLAAIVQRLTGGSLIDYLRPRLFDPLGIGRAGWDQHPPGRDLGFTGMYSTTDAVARLGELYLRRGVWQGRRILPESWVAEATRRHIATPEPAESDWGQGYGFQFWMSRHGYRGDGAYGQYCVVLPEQDAVIAYTGATVDMQSVLDAMWRHLLPAFGDPVGPTAEDAALADRLAALALPPVSAGARPGETAGSWSLAPAPAATGERPDVTGIDVTTGADGTTIVLREPDTVLRLPLGVGEWAVTDGPGAPPAAVSGGWTEPSTLVFDVLFLEAPHRISVTCDLAAATFDARWITTPLHTNRPHRLHAPPA